MILCARPDIFRYSDSYTQKYDTSIVLFESILATILTGSFDFRLFRLLGLSFNKLNAVDTSCGILISATKSLEIRIIYLGNDF